MKRTLIRRGDIFQAHFPLSEETTDKLMPVIVIQNNIANKYSSTIIVAPIISRGQKKLPTHVEIKNFSIFNVESLILSEKLKSIDRKKLVRKIGNLEQEDMERVDKALLISQGISFSDEDKEKTEMYYRLTLGEEILGTEDYSTEFKEVCGDFIKLIKKTILKYCVGFLNSQGGKLYYGVTDKKIIKGVKITSNQLDTIKTTINNELYNIFPRLSLDHFQINFKEVYDKENKIINDLYVVEIVVSKYDNGTIYFANNKELFVRGNGVTNKLGGMEMVSYIKKNIKGAN